MLWVTWTAAQVSTLQRTAQDIATIYLCHSFVHHVRHIMSQSGSLNLVLVSMGKVVSRLWAIGRQADCCLRRSSSSCFAVFAPPMGRSPTQKYEMRRGVRVSWYHLRSPYWQLKVGGAFPNIYVNDFWPFFVNSLTQNMSISVRSFKFQIHLFPFFKNVTN